MNAERLENVHTWSLYAIVVLPVLPIIGSSALPLLGALAFFSLVVASWFVHRSGLGQAIPERLWNVVVVGFVFFSVARVFLTDADGLDTVMQLLLILTLIRLVGRQSVRDELQIFVLSLVTLAAATTLTDQLAFGIAFSAYVLLGTFALAVFHLRNEVRVRPKISFRGIQTLNRPYAAVLGGMSGIVLAASLGIFFAFPRVGLGFFAPKDRDGVQMTGFSESVELGNHGVIRDNPSVVLRVEFDKKPANTDAMHWRMMAFDRYDGRAWSRTLIERRNTLPSVSDDDRKRVMGLATRQQLQSIEGLSSGVGDVLHMQIYMEPLGTTHLPTLWPSKFVRLGSDTVSVPFGPRSGWVQADSYGDLHHTVADQVGMIYQLWAWEAGGIQRNRRDRSAYLQLPVLSPRFGQLANTIAGGSRDPSEIAQRIATHLQSNYQYTTDLPPVGANPVESFLFETKRGHCEYFATTATLLLRQSGVPARIVNGFLGGSWNSVGGYLAVRQGDAHTWVEYLTLEGEWRMLDPTPASAIEAPNAAAAAVREYSDALKLFWSKWIIEYDLNAQLDVLRRVSNSFNPRSASDSAREQDEDDKPSLAWGPPLTVVLGFGLAFFVGGFLTRRDNPPRFFVVALVQTGATFGVVSQVFELDWAASAAVAGALGFAVTWLRRPRWSVEERAWRVIEEAASAVGVTRASDEGPEAFLERLRPMATDDSVLNAFRNAYLRSRFGNGPTPPELVESAHQVAKILKQVKGHR